MIAPSHFWRDMLKYLKEHIIDEIDGAVDYMTKAVEKKGHRCGEMFRHMSGMELEHANELLRMFRTTERPSTVTDAEYAQMHKEILDAYSDGMSKVEAMKKIYWES